MRVLSPNILVLAAAGLPGLFSANATPPTSVDVDLTPCIFSSSEVVSAPSVNINIPCDGNALVPTTIGML